MSDSSRVTDRGRAVLVGIAAFVSGFFLMASGGMSGNNIELVAGSFLVSFGLFSKLPTKWFRLVCIIGTGIGLAYVIRQYVFLST